MNEELAQQINDVLEENGWNQPHLLYFITRSEFVKVNEFTEHPLKQIQYLTNLHKKGVFKAENIDAIFLASEGWAYPKDIFGDGGPGLTEQEMMAMAKILPPRAHPNKQEFRQVVVITNSFEVFSFSKFRDGEIIVSGKVNSAINGPEIAGATYNALMEYAQEVMK